MQSDDPFLNKQPITQHSDTIFGALEESCCDLKLKLSPKEVRLKSRSGKLSFFDLLFQLSCSSSSYYEEQHLLFHSRQKIDMSFVLCMNTTSSIRDRNYISLLNWSYLYYTVVATTPNYLKQQRYIKIIVHNNDFNPIFNFECYTLNMPQIIG